MAETETTEQPKQKENVWAAENVGSGTFSITKPKRKKTKLRQSRVKKPRRGARK